MLTGDPRTATVRAIGDVRALEIPAERFREVALERPAWSSTSAASYPRRRTELDAARARRPPPVDASPRATRCSRGSRGSSGCLPDDVSCQLPVTSSKRECRATLFELELLTGN